MIQSGSRRGAAFDVDRLLQAADAALDAAKRACRDAVRAAPQD
jgi:hypothetical protein